MRRGWALQPAGTATTVIGVSFALLSLLSAPWSHTQLLSDVARTGRVPQPIEHLLLFLMLFVGAIVGGHARGRIRTMPGAGAPVARILSGSALMGAGSVLVPGSNDTLILTGLPFLAPQALLALLVMAATIAVAIALAGDGRRRGAVG